MWIGDLLPRSDGAIPAGADAVASVVSAGCFAAPTQDRAVEAGTLREAPFSRALARPTNY
jgi:hypothetical protein